MEDKKILVTVITVTRNDKKGLEKTLESVRVQTYPFIESVIIDGNSDYDIRDLFQHYEKKFDEKGILHNFISEKDKGIYDAMNKGTSYARGEWVIYMNSGDTFASPEVLKNVFGKRSFEENDVIFGNWIKEYEKKHVKVKANPIERLSKSSPTIHQATFFRQTQIEKYGYDVRYPIMACYETLVRMYLDHLSFAYVPDYICFFAMDGISNAEVFKRSREQYHIRKKYNIDKRNGLIKICEMCAWFIIDKGIKIKKLFTR